ncbi:MAG: hypothetical protein NVSMB19_00610 [Vulcanimicrobiaceae bacterium]
MIEFNELTATLLRKFMAENELPNFKRFYDSSTVYTTTAGDDPLEPWIQWPTVHCGVPYGEHGALRLGDGARIAQKAVGTVLSERGIRVGIFGMMNGNYVRPNGYYVPDPWDARAAVHPRELTPFFDFVASQVRENTRSQRPSLVQTLEFGRFMLGHGLSLSTAFALGRQVVSERVRPGLKWRRAIILDRLQYDVFRNLNRKHRVRFASFFSNSTAHLQHYFWRDMAPEGFHEPPSPRADPSLRDAVRFGYRSMDRLLGRIVRDHPQHRLILCTALSQEAWFKTTKCTYRPIDFRAFLRFAGIRENVRIVPVMAERFRLECDDATEARSTASALGRLTFRAAALMSSEVVGTTVHTGCAIIDPEPELLNEPVEVRDTVLPFGKLLYRITAMNSGRHSANGSLWIRNGTHRVVAEPVSLAAIAPTILAYLGVEAPTTMRPELALAES